jgi:hypothetical protein
MILIGSILLYYDGPSSTSISLVASLIILIGLLTLGALLASILAISLSARTLARRTHTQASFREKIEAEEPKMLVKKENGCLEEDTSDFQTE